MTQRDEAIEIYRKVISLVYRELGAMRAENHEVLHQKSSLPGSELARDRKDIARRIYCGTRFESDPHRLEASYSHVWGLSLEDALDAFRDGDWLLGGRKYSFGGQKWAAIADAAIRLRTAIKSDDQVAMLALLDEVPLLTHNNGPLTDKFRELICP